ncbi:sulfurtransferase TusA family protein [Shimazuella kribbensis]|uniref:sulfurtransferase TusA family protein n=1 Tax=Shimazuella kribbensis TaxID=139808 RepID=UPI000416A3FA|nr:sulfurtransferase TusA family protein [Shimazuella kribbensis]
MSIHADFQLDCKGLACPMPIVRTKKAMDQLKPGQVIEVQATDVGSLADMKGWAQSTGNQYLGTKQEGETFIHYLRKANEDEAREETKHPHVVDNEEFVHALEQEGEQLYLIDVREPAEYAFGHIPSAISIPFGQLEDRIDEIPKDKTIFVICRTGTRSDLAAQQLSKHGLKAINIVPGMSQWTSETVQDQ